jgi:NAD(P)H dehydrogenase (quinone)
MRFLVIYAHPVEDSFQSAIHRCVVKTLAKAGHDVDDCDLYRENFQPILTRDERLAYHTVDANRPFAAKEIERLLECDGLILVFPTWWYGMPAILKGYIDRVWIPGVAFEVVGARTRPLLNKIVRFAVVTTYGSPWWLNKLMGDPNRRVLMCGIRHLFSPDARTLWLAEYGMDAENAASRARFLSTVERRLETF